MPTFVHAGQRLAYTEYGAGPRTTVLLPGLLFSQRIHQALARELAARGNRVVTLDLLGHGASDRPADMTQYSMTLFAEQTVALLDHLGLEDAVVGGTSLGANTALETAAIAPERVRGMIVEMPVLDRALLGCALAFTPLLVGLTFGAPAWRLAGNVTRALPRAVTPFWGQVVLDWFRQDPDPSAAVLQGLFFGRVAPPKRERANLRMPSLVIGHTRDPIHPFSDSTALAEELPDGRFVQASSFFELRFRPERLTGEIATFLDECWKPRAAAGKKRRAS